MRPSAPGNLMQAVRVDARAAHFGAYSLPTQDNLVSCQGTLRSSGQSLGMGVCASMVVPESNCTLLWCVQGDGAAVAHHAGLRMIPTAALCLAREAVLGKPVQS